MVLKCRNGQHIDEMSVDKCFLRQPGGVNWEYWNGRSKFSFVCGHFQVGNLQVPGAGMRFLQTGRVIAAVALVALAIGLGSRAQASEIDDAMLLHPTLLSSARVYHLRMHHLHTGEDIDVVYRVGDLYVPTAIEALNRFLRDHRTGDVAHYDPREFDLLHSIVAKLGKQNGVVDIVCGYRTPWSNNFLRSRGAETGVAEHSQHIQGRAIDIRIPGVSTVKLRDTALSMDAGGVGYYPRSQFVHVDVGPVREWSYGVRQRRVRLVRATYSKHRHGRHGVIRQVGY
jgi:uncharacterized protein YcbK (DUF882 family)